MSAPTDNSGATPTGADASVTPDPAAVPDAPVALSEPTDPTPAPSAPKTLSVRARILLVVGSLIIAALAYAATSALLNAGDNSASAPSTIDASTAVTYTSDEYRFSVQFPSEPTETTQTQAVLNYEIELLTVQWVNRDTLYSANAATFPNELIDGQELDSLLRNSVGGVASATGGTLSEEAFADIDGRRAITATVSYPTGELGRLMVVLDGTTQYSLLSTGSESDWLAFLDSFAFSG